MSNSHWYSTSLPLSPPAAPPFSLLLKCSTSTFFLLLPSTSSFSDLQSQLFELLNPNTAHLPESLTSPSPSGPASLKLGLPKDPSDPKKGFVALDDATYKKGKGTIGSAGIKDNGIIAFAVDEGSWDGEFDVQLPVDDYYDSQTQTQTQDPTSK
ncbi:hypothetical protein H072_4201 [Dactylellina haptotyla CBS 200.50]|uniref:Uncharacterized protein n=1 Tax=Dactylellina haptotyla (strain CBS 200.50) TaxID=1284197 RepID=S8AG35_DACHA|nr:hypothetical protein H072_4201 [Dactylellina haptotyla CBS 200.50]